MDIIVDAIPPGMVRIYWGFWPQRLLRRRWPLWICQLPARQENWTLQNAKPDHPVFPKTTIAPSHRHEHEASKDGSFANQPGSSQGRIGLRSKSSANGEAEPDVEKSPEEVAAEQDKILEAKAETRTEVRAIS
jgi:hypothetical protein